MSTARTCKLGPATPTKAPLTALAIENVNVCACDTLGVGAWVRGGLRRLNIVALTWTRVMVLTVGDWESLTEAYPELREAAEAFISEDDARGGGGSAPSSPSGKSSKQPEAAPAVKVVDKVIQLINTHAPDLGTTSTAALAAAMAIELAAKKRRRPAADGAAARSRVRGRTGSAVWKHA